MNWRRLKKIFFLLVEKVLCFLLLGFFSQIFRLYGFCSFSFINFSFKWDWIYLKYFSNNIQNKKKGFTKLKKFYQKFPKKFQRFFSFKNTNEESKKRSLESKSHFLHSFSLFFFVIFSLFCLIFFLIFRQIFSIGIF